MNESQLLQQKITFYQDSANVKEQIARSEADRLKLEIELNKIINSEDSLAKAKAIKLKAYYTKLCDEETKSAKRNQQLLADLQRVDTQFQQLEVKLERLTNLKKECEIYLRSSYPKWTSEKRIAQTPEQIDNHRQTLSKGIELIAENLYKIDQLNQSKLNDLYREESLKSKLNKTFNETKSNKTPLLEAVSMFTATSLPDNINNETIRKGSLQQMQPADNGESLNEAVNNGTIRQLIQASHIKTYEPSATITNVADLGTTLGINNLLKEYEREIKRQDSNPIEFTMANTSSGNFMNNMMDTKYEPVQEDAPISPLRYLAEKTIPKDIAKQEEIELDLDGLFKMLDYVELEINHLIHPENFYRQTEISEKHKKEIIHLAMTNKPLSELDSLNVSMVIKYELPELIKKFTSQSCFFNTSVLVASLNDINDSTIKDTLRSNQDLILWERLMKHFVVLKKTAHIDSLSIAQIFALGFISDTVYSDKAVKILEKLINLETNPIDMLGDSLTETSINKELQVASNSKLKNSSAYQQFIMSSTHNSNKSRDALNDSEEDDDIDALVAPKGTSSTVNESLKQNVIISSILKSPKKGSIDYEQSPSLKSTEELKSTGLSMRSSRDKKLPVHLRNFDESSSESEESEENLKRSGSVLNTVRLDNDHDFYS